MHDPMHIVAAATATSWTFTYGLRKAPFWKKLPEDAKWAVPFIAASVFALAESLQSGRSWRESVGIAASATIAAMAAHHGMKAAPGPYGGKPTAGASIPPSSG